MIRILGTLGLVFLVGCESISVPSLNNSSFNNKDVSGCDGSFQCHVIELPMASGCASPSGYQVYSTKALSELEAQQYEQWIIQQHVKQQADTHTCPTVYPVQALCVNKTCEAITLGK